MKILQKPVKLRRGERVKVTFSRPAIVLLMTEVNFKRYKEGASHRRMGGHFDQSPAEFTAPYDGMWHAVIEKGSHFNPKPITGSVEVLPPAPKEISYLDEPSHNPITEESVDEEGEENNQHEEDAENEE